MCRVKPQDDFCVSVQVPVGRVPRVILMGVRSDVEAAARRNPENFPRVLRDRGPAAAGALPGDCGRCGPSLRSVFV